MNTAEINKVFAAFIGKQSKDYFINLHDEVEFVWDIPEGTIQTASLKYHCSWDWLMPVVEKIETIASSVIIGRFFCEIKHIDALDSKKTFNIRIASGVKMNAIYEACYQFIQWYNENNK